MESQTVKSKFFFTAGVVGMLSGVASGTTDGAEVDYGREWNPYVTLRGGWLLGEYKMCEHYDIGDWNWKRSTESGWSYSAEAGVACFEDRVFLGLEFGYFGEKIHDNFKCDPPEVSRIYGWIIFWRTAKLRIASVPVILR